MRRASISPNQSMSLISRRNENDHCKIVLHTLNSRVDIVQGREGAYCMFFGGCLVSQSSRKQHVVARSSTEAKYRALAHVAVEILQIQSLLSELHVNLPRLPVLWCDNMRATSLAANPVAHVRTKHIEIDVPFIRDMMIKKELEIRYVPTLEQTTDVLTKRCWNRSRV